MALTKVQTIGIETGVSLTGVTTVTTLNASTDTLSVGGTVNFGGNVSIAGTLTYEDVTNVDSVGIVTAQSGLNVGPKTGIACTISAAGAITAAGKLTVGSGLAQGGKPIEVNTLDGFDRFVVSGGGAITATGDLTLTDSSGSTGRSVDLGGGSNWGIRSNPTSGTNSYGFEIYKSTDNVKLSIDSNGNFGFGDTVPSNFTGYTNLSIHGSTGGVITFGDDGTDEWEIYGGDGILKIYDRTNTAERLRIDSAGNVAISNAIPSSFQSGGRNLVVGADSAENGITIYSTTSGNLYFGDGTSGSAKAEGYIQYLHSSNRLDFGTSNSRRMTIDSSGRLLVGTTSTYDNEASNLVVASSSHTGITVASTGSDKRTNLYFADGTSSTAPYVGGFTYDHAGDHLLTRTNGSERMRIDSSGRLMLGTTTEGEHTADDLTIATSGDTGISIRSGTSSSGRLFFSDGTSSADEYRGFVQYGHSNNAMLFGTDATERMRIDSSGNLYLNKTANNRTDNGLLVVAGGSDDCTLIVTNERTSGGSPIELNRQSSDGTLISFYQAGSAEGSITVSGSSVSYNGGHLSRWTQLPGNAERTEILRGSVLSNLDEMCEWGEEDNEQLNRMKVSDVEGDKNVSGVFQAWDDDDDTYTNDFYCAMTGDFVIRIAQGITVERGDLLMSAGDGTAKPQDDDIVRSKTIAKVTSTTVSTTYSDGSYCVPCVLMAC